MTASISPNPKLSVFTLALLEDSGWYQVNYSHAHQITFGRGNGCGFIYETCIDPETETSRFPEFCAANKEKTCSVDRLNQAECHLIYREDLPEEFDYFGTKKAGWDRFADGCPTPRNIPLVNCTVVKAPGLGVKGSDSRCFTFHHGHSQAASICMQHHVIMNSIGCC